MTRRIIDRLGGFLFPARAFCMSCGDPAGQEENWLCPRCRARLRPGVHVIQSAEWPKDGVSRAWFSLYYEEPVSGLIRSYKYQGVYRLAPFFIDNMRPLLDALDRACYDCLVPVPLHEKRRLERGFNQAEALARLVSADTGIPLVNALRRTKNTRRQARLSAGDRKNNVRNAFESVVSLRGLRVLLVDDVFTTGSTANSCAQVLRAAGAADVQALTIAASRYFRGRKGKVFHKKPAPIKTNS